MPVPAVLLQCSPCCAVSMSATDYYQVHHTSYFFRCYDASAASLQCFLFVPPAETGVLTPQGIGLDSAFGRQLSAFVVSFIECDGFHHSRCLRFCVD